MEKTDISPAQVRAARAFLKWEGPQLAEAAGVSLSTLRRLESGKTDTSPLAMGAIVRALEDAGVEFVENGVKLVKASR